MWRRADVTEWWAHFAHAFDTLHLCAAAYRLNWRVRAAMAGYGPVGVDISPPGESRWIAIRDLYRVVPSSLAEIAKSFELPQKLFGKEDYRGDMRDLSRERLRAGCVTDAVLVSQTLDVVSTLFASHGGELRATFPASALTVLKASLKERGEKFPKMVHARSCSRGIECRCYWSANIAARAAYYGARVEVFHHAPAAILTEFDVSSSYPWSMAQTLPVHWQGTVSGRLARRAFESRVHGIYDAQVTVPRMEFPPLPWKPEEAGGIYFPTGTWSGSFAMPELAYAEELGCRVRVTSVLTYDARPLFAPYVESLYVLKRDATGARRHFLKYLLNGSYGKFGEKPDRERLFFIPDELEALHYQWSEPNVRAINPEVDPRLLAQTEVRYAPHAHYAIASYITAYSRILLHQRMREARDLAYTDTDSLHCSSWPGATGNELGQLKVELAGFRGRYYAPKLYSLHEPTSGAYLVDPLSGKVRVACKGFLKQSGEDFESVIESAAVFDTLISAGVPRELAKEGARGMGQTLTRTRLLRSQFKPGATHHSVLRVKQSKSWSGLSKKRKPFSDGSTEAWTVNEIRRGKHLSAKCPIL